jgi:hypothetical protein
MHWEAPTAGPFSSATAPVRTNSQSCRPEGLRRERASRDDVAARTRRVSGYVRWRPDSLNRACFNTLPRRVDYAAVQGGEGLVTEHGRLRGAEGKLQCSNTQS